MRERKKNFFGRTSGTGKIPKRKDTTFKIRMRRNSGIKNSNSDILSEKFVFLCVRTPVVNGLFYPFHEGKAFVFEKTLDTTLRFVYDSRGEDNE